MANLHTTDLATDGLGQFIDELDDTRILIGGSHLLHVLLQFLDEVVASFVLPLLTQHDGSLHHHASDVVGNTCDGALYDSGVGHQRTLYLERTNAVATRFDDVVDTTLKPVVAVFVAPGHITSVIESVVPGLTGKLWVAVVLLEETDGLAVAYTHHNLALLTIFTRCTVGADQVDVVLGVGDTHRTGFRLHPGEGAEGHRGLCLSEAFHHLDACLLVELFEDGRVQGFTSCTTVLQTREVVLREVLANHETIDGGRCTERGHLVFLDLTQQRVGIELLMVEHEDCRASKPLSVELAPYGLAPASIGYGEVE